MSETWQNLLFKRQVHGQAANPGKNRRALPLKWARQIERCHQKQGRGQGWPETPSDLISPPALGGPKCGFLHVLGPSVIK